MHTKYSYKEITQIKEDEIVPLYDDAGWVAYTNDIPKLIRGFKNSLYVYGVYDKSEMVGLIRVVGDQETIIYIQDLIVLKTHQRQGLASDMLKHVVSKYQDVRQIILLTEDNPSLIAFYEAAIFHLLVSINVWHSCRHTKNHHNRKT